MQCVWYFCMASAGSYCLALVHLDCGLAPFSVFCFSEFEAFWPSATCMAAKIVHLHSLRWKLVFCMFWIFLQFPRWFCNSQFACAFLHTLHEIKVFLHLLQALNFCLFVKFLSLRPWSHSWCRVPGGLLALLHPATKSVCDSSWPGSNRQDPGAAEPNHRRLHRWSACLFSSELVQSATQTSAQNWSWIVPEKIWAEFRQPSRASGQQGDNLIFNEFS